MYVLPSPPTVKPEPQKPAGASSQLQALPEWTPSLHFILIILLCFVVLPCTWVYLNNRHSLPVKITHCYNSLQLFPWPWCTACRIWVPWPGTESRPRQWKPRVLTTGPTENSLTRSIFEMNTVDACSSDSFILTALYLLFHSMNMSPFTYPVHCWWSFEIIPVSLQKNAAMNVLVQKIYPK